MNELQRIIKQYKAFNSAVIVINNRNMRVTKRVTELHNE